MKSILKKVIPHILVLILFVIVSVSYFSPVLQGKKIFQSDIVQYTGMAKQQNDFRANTGAETYWTNSAFGGMPTYQLGAKYPHNYIKKLDLTLRFLPRPADYLFLYFIGIYILFLVFKIDYKLALLGALAFGFSTYLIIILGVGHNAKAHAIAYMPLVLSGIILTFRKRYLYGFLLTTVAMALELVTNHFQMTYYLLLLVVVLGIAYLVDAFRKNELPQYFKSLSVMAIAVILALGLNATNFLATQEYAKESTRGKSELTINSDGTEKESSNALSNEYITEYSYGIVETFDLFIPGFMGGSNGESVGDDSDTYDFFRKNQVPPLQAKEMVKSLPMYWGDQPIVAGPAYIGAVVFFLAILGMFLVKGRIKWWLLGGIILSLLLSWGKNFGFFTNFFIDYVPLYNKFRAVSSIQVIIEICMPILAVMGLHYFFKDSVEKEKKVNAIKYSAIILGGISLIFLAFKNSLFDFAGGNDGYYIQSVGQDFVDALKTDRKSMFTSDTFRSLFFVILSAGTLWFLLKGKLKKVTAIVILIVLLVIDLTLVDRRYVNNDSFVAARQMDKPFQENAADLQILEDKEHYRVYDISGNPFSSGRASYFHNALGGYSAVKLKRIQDIDDFYLSKGDIGILNMMNVRYLIQTGESGGVSAQINPYANGNAWFVQNVKIVEDANEEILSLDSLNTKQTAIVHKDFERLIPNKIFAQDSTATINLASFTSNQLVYDSESKEDRLAVFSEVYYPNGWNAYIDGKLTESLRADYLLRALYIPKGIHKIEFKFEPNIVITGGRIALGSSILFGLMLLGGLYFEYKKKA